MKAYKHLINYALAQGLCVSVLHEEEWQLKRSTDAAAIVAAVESVEEASLIIRDRDKWILSYVCRALVSAYGLAADETVIDHTDNAWADEWWENYKGGAQ